MVSSLSIVGKLGIFKKSLITEYPRCKFVDELLCAVRLDGYLSGKVATVPALLYRVPQSVDGDGVLDADNVHGGLSLVWERRTINAINGGNTGKGGYLSDELVARFCLNNSEYDRIAYVLPQDESCILDVY